MTIHTRQISNVVRDDTNLPRRDAIGGGSITALRHAVTAPIIHQIAHPTPTIAMPVTASFSTACDIRHFQIGEGRKFLELRFIASYDASSMRQVLKLAPLVSAILGVLSFLIAFSNYHLFVEGTVDKQGQIIHEQWRVASAKFYCVLACVFLVLPLVRWLGNRQRNEGISR